MIDLCGQSEKLKVTYRGVEYTWSGGFGSIIESFESGVKQDEVRQFGNVTLYAYRVYKNSIFNIIFTPSLKQIGKSKICWSAPNVDANWIREFKKELFSVLTDYQ